MVTQQEPITRENWFECSQLQVKLEQKDFVSSNLLCIAEAQFYPGWGAYAVYDDDQMVGFAMYEDDEEQEAWWISALMIAAEHQGKGYGKAAAQALLDLVRRKGCQEIWVGYAKDNDVPKGLYAGLGFTEVGLDEEGDRVARLQLADK